MSFVEGSITAQEASPGNQPPSNPYSKYNLRTEYTRLLVYSVTNESKVNFWNQKSTPNREPSVIGYQLCVPGFTQNSSLGLGKIVNTVKSLFWALF